MNGFWNKIIEYTNEESDYKKIAQGSIDEGVSWILYHSPELGFAVHGNWQTQAEADFADDLVLNNVVDDLVLAFNMIPMLKKFGNDEGWKPEQSEATDIVFSIFQEAGKAARKYVDEVLRSV